MKRIIPVILVFICFDLNGQESFDPPDVYYASIAKADSLASTGAYELAAKMYTAAFVSFGGRGLPEDRYKSARTFGLAGNLDSLLVTLGLLCKESKYWNYQLAATDPALEDARKTRQWPAILDCMRLNKETYAPAINISYFNMFDSIYDADQWIRKELSRTFVKKDSARQRRLMDQMAATDQLNTSRVVDFLDAHGWQGEEVIGSKGNTAQFLVIQHANIKVQEKYLPMMKQAVKEGKARSQSLALLEDRITVANTGTQVYGSQLRFMYATRKYEFFPIIDEKNVNKRRAEAGLNTLEEYAKGFGIDYKSPD